MGTITNLKLIKFSNLKFSLISSFFGLLNGFVFGLLFFLFVKFSIDALGMSDLPMGALFVLCFILVPLLFALIFFIIGYILSWILDLSLKLVKGINLSVEEQE